MWTERLHHSWYWFEVTSAKVAIQHSTDADKMILFICSIIWDIGIPQQDVTIMYEDNNACTAMANAQKPTF